MLKDARVAATLECARAGYLDKLRKQLTRLATAKGAGAAPPQAFERWRFAAKHAEDATSALDPVIPAGAGKDATKALIDDLTRAGVSTAHAKEIAKDIAETSERYAKLVRTTHQRLTSKEHPWTEANDDSDSESDDDDDSDDVMTTTRTTTTTALGTERLVVPRVHPSVHRMVIDSRRRRIQSSLGGDAFEPWEPFRGDEQARVRQDGGDVHAIHAPHRPGVTEGGCPERRGGCPEAQSRKRRLGR